MSAHNYTGYAAGCRCDVCRAAKNEYMRTRRQAARLRAQLAAGRPALRFVEGIQHGRYGYEERGCRCPVCMEAMAERARGQYAKRIEQVAS